MKQVSDHILRRVYILFGLFVLFGAIILLRIFALQVNVGYWTEKEIEEQVFFKKVLADRGNILSEDGTIMATSLPFYKIALDPSILDTTKYPGYSDSLYKLSLNFALLEENEEERDSLRVYRKVMKAIAERDRHVYLHRQKLNFHQLEVVKEWPLLSLGRLKGGLVVEKFSRERFYPLGDLARITLGKIIRDTVPIRGIEYSFHNELRGEDGYILAQKVVGGSYIPVNQFGEDASTDGYDVVTTLDVDLQDIVENALEKAVVRNYAKFGTAILMEVETGKIKAIANYPETYNHAIATQIEPGSTFKTASAAALFEDKLVSPTDIIATGNGSILYDDKEVTDNGKAWGNITFEKVFAHSSNVGVSKTLNEMYEKEPEKYLAHLRRFGFFDRANVQLSGEPLPRIIMPEDKDWTIATLPSLSYGYSLLVTPIQMASFYNAIANDGKLIRPWIIKGVADNSRVVKEYRPEVLEEKMLSDETIEQLKQVMKAVTDYGTAASAFKGFEGEVAGKTGTARKTEIGKGYVRKYRASFGGFYPVDTPRYSMYIMIDEPDGGTSSGGKVAAPVFREVMDEILKMDVKLTQPPKRKDQKPHRKPAPKAVFAQTAREVYGKLNVATSSSPNSEWYTTTSNKHQVNLDVMSIEEGKVPNVKGMTTRDALILLEKLGLRVELKGNGRVRTQSLLPGHRPKEGASITLYCS
ncbi:MAG: transpeptidase family protein [Bacteroidia bacterium]|nr:transpeptidase family protein [Bacteroidia bacterium]